MDLVVVPPWIPQDDLLLKNAVEAGASLEALAKGAVRFSRKYSLTELRDRWRSLLYDDDVSAQASVAMVNLELSGKASGIGTKEEEGDGVKRKRYSIRKQYYMRRKRVCRQVFNSSDVNLGKNDDGVELGKVGNLSNDVGHLIVSNLDEYENFEGLEEGGGNNLMSEIPLWKTIEDVSAPAMPAMPFQVSAEDKNDGVEARAVTVSDGLKGKCDGDVLHAPAAVVGDDGVRLSDSLLNLTNEDEIVFMDVDGKDSADKPCYENVDLLILSSPCKIEGNDVSDICESQKFDAETQLTGPSRSSVAGLEIGSNPLDVSQGDLCSISDPGNDVQSSAAARSPRPELNQGFMFCVLNTEDPDIPSNDCADVSIVVPHLATLKPQPIVKEVGHSDSSINNQRKNEPDRSLKKGDIPSPSLAASQMVRPGLVPNINSTQPPLGVVVKTENPGRNPIPAVSRQSDHVNINTSDCRLIHATMTPALDGHRKQEEIDARASGKVYAQPRAEEHKDLPKLEAKSLSLDQEDDDDDSDNEDDYDNEIPYFSDAETMILEMDLCPADQDANASREVLRYQHEKTKRTIMRLEQCAQSFMQRAMASQGALAVFYGRHLKQYIKKSEVIIGRATNDMPVDIDLGREGRANKISRRQALIKMESDGSFIIKNLGKSPIFLNGKEVATGQLRRLSASSLIEIRGMSFIFEINNKPVRSL